MAPSMRSNATMLLPESYMFIIAADALPGIETCGLKRILGGNAGR
jgi:hypothetical protein